VVVTVWCCHLQSLTGRLLAHQRLPRHLHLPRRLHLLRHLHRRVHLHVCLHLLQLRLGLQHLHEVQLPRLQCELVKQIMKLAQLQELVPWLHQYAVHRVMSVWDLLSPPVAEEIAAGAV